LNLKFTRKGNILIVSVDGEIDHHSSETIRSKVDDGLATAGVKHLVFDFSRVNFMNSSGIGMLLGRYKNVARLGGKVWIASVNDTVRRILDMSGVLKLIPAVQDVSDVVSKYL